MRLMLWIIAGLTALYCGYWALAARTLRTEAEATLAAMRAEGRADAAAIEVGGFPARFDVTLTAPQAASPDGRIRWSADALRLYALSYRPQHVIAIFPPEQRVAIGGETVTVTSAELSASAVFGLAPELPLDRAQAVGTEFSLVSGAGWAVAADVLRAAIRNGEAAAAHDIGIELAGITLSGVPARIVTAGEVLPARGERFYLDATVTLDRPLDRVAAVEGVQLRAVDIRSLALDWGPAGMSGRGAVALDDVGVPEGRIELSFRNWRAVLRLATALGLVRAETAPTVERALEGLATLGGNAEVLMLPLVFAGGRASLGPVPLGPAPRL